MPETLLDGQKIVWREAGEGPAVILLHCSSSHSGQWKPLIERLKNDYRCLAPDLHGYGQSTLYPAGARAYGSYDVGIVGHLLEEAGGEAHIIGHSLGGTVALRAALTFPEQVRSLTLFEPVLFGFLEAVNDPVRIEYLQVTNNIHVMLRFGMVEEAAVHFTDFWMGDGAFAAMDDGTKAYVIAGMPRVAEDWFGISNVAPDCLRLEDVGQLTMPCHLMRTGQTRDSVKKIMDLLEAAMPGAQRSGLDGAGHMAPVTHAGEVNPLIEAFLREQA